MRVIFALFVICTISLALGCSRGGQTSAYPTLTGTCAGACDHYLSCKSSQGGEVSQRNYQICERECTQVFSGAETLMAFESLACEDAIAFVEGSSGRGPGDPVGHSQAPAPDKTP